MPRRLQRLSFAAHGCGGRRGEFLHRRGGEFGFRIIRDHPTAVLAWALVYFVIVVLPQFGAVAMIWNSFAGLAAVSAATGGSDKPSPELLQAASRLQASLSVIQLIQLAGSLLWASLFFGAVYRAVLEPQSHARWFMRFSNQELWLGVVLAVGYMLLVFAIFAGMIPLVIYGAIVSALGDMGGADWAGIAFLGLAMAGACCWAATRLSLGSPMSFAERNFRLFESWSLTRGHALRMFLAYLAAFALASLLQMIAFALLGGVVLGVVLGHLARAGLSLDQADVAMRALAQNPPDNWLALAIVAGLIGGLLLSVLSAALTTIIIAPMASIYRQLTGGTPAAA